jgi:HEAT repeat protein
MNLALRHLGALPDDVDPALFERAVRRAPYALAALQAIASLQDQRYLPAIQTALNPSWIPDGRYKQSVVAAAVEALVSCPGDAATEVLLDAMVASPSEEVRNRCSVAVDQRRQALEQRAAWERAKEVRIAAADTVARLVGLLQDDDAAIRVQAARGLATLRAVEALPRLIEALRDENAAVREAVSAALDRLNATADERAGD